MMQNVHRLVSGKVGHLAGARFIAHKPGNLPSLRSHSISFRKSQSHVINCCGRQARLQSTHTVSRTSDDASHVVRSPLPSVTVPEESFCHYVFSATRQYRDRAALVDHLTGQQWTFTQMKDAAVRVASGLCRLGLGRGDTLLLLSFNCPQFAILFLACAAAGIIVSTANPMYTPEELARQLQMSGCTAIAVGEDLVPTVHATFDLDPTLQDKVKLKQIVIGKAEGYMPFSVLLEDDGKAFPENTDFRPKEDTLVLPYSSGTTGLPKGVMLTHTNIVANILQQQGMTMGTPGEGSMLGVAPLYHAYGFIMTWTALHAGHTVVFLPSFHPAPFLSAISAHRVTILPLVPPLVLFLAKDPQVLNYDISSVHKVMCAAAPLGSGISEEFAARSSALLMQGFGMSETILTHLNNPPIKHGTVGHVMSSTEAKIVDENTGEALGAGQTGELYVRGPQVMKGYFNNPQATQDTIVDGWLRTGDLGHYDEEGYFTITDRLKELIKYKGFQVAPAELEALLLTHPAVGDVAVVGIADQEAGELPTAFVVPKAGATVCQEDVIHFLHSKVAPHKRLRGGVRVVDSIPKNPSGKILRRVLRESMGP
ncbi:uncharacterized protein LOC143286390 isoform X2 [Babylonia areolata]|uniref:uncharacterized protein LOC143286390 isoform X2 n=1 Tax=Babylonia areolata TaxID=304850 RepID=UPI003FD2D0AB